MRQFESLLNSKLTTIEKIYDGGSSGTSLPASNLTLTKAFTDFSAILIEWYVGSNRRQCCIRPTDFGVYYYDSFGTYQSNTWYFAKIIFQFPANQDNKKITFGSPDVTGWSDSPKLRYIWGIY